MNLFESIESNIKRNIKYYSLNDIVKDPYTAVYQRSLSDFTEIYCYDMSKIFKANDKVTGRDVIINKANLTTYDMNIISNKDNPIIFSECKTYLDKCYFDRANSDFKHFKNIDNNKKCIVVSLENGIAPNAENYFMDQGNTDKIFYLVDGKRTSKKPIWKNEFYKPINIEVLSNLINYIDNIIKQHM